MSTKITVGIDEVGRGPLAGPVFAAAVALINPVKGLKDSKKLSAKQREILFFEIQANAKVGIGSASVQEIDEINILQASLLAMKRAYETLNINADLVLVDGNIIPNICCNKIEAIIGGDSKILEISAASIIAKVTRDRVMQKLALEFPYYFWENNSGYGTKQHIEAIEKQGICMHHRRSFAPIKKFIF